MPSNLKPKADDGENEARNRGGETEGRPNRRKRRSGKKLRGRPESERKGKRREKPL